MEATAARFATLRWRLVPLYVATLVVLIPFVGNLQQHRAVQQSANAAAAQVGRRSAVTRLAGRPVRIVVPDAAIDLSVVPNGQNPITKDWVVAPSQANYAVITAPVNNSNQGQTLIYGHNNRHVFGPLLNLQPGATVYVYTDNNHIFQYRYASFHDISPSTQNFFDSLKHGDGLVLMTCDGPDFQYRHVMYLSLVKGS